MEETLADLSCWEKKEQEREEKERSWCLFCLQSRMRPVHPGAKRIPLYSPQPFVWLGDFRLRIRRMETTPITEGDVNHGTPLQRCSPGGPRTECRSGISRTPKIQGFHRQEHNIERRNTLLYVDRERCGLPKQRRDRGLTLLCIDRRA